MKNPIYLFLFLAASYLLPQAAQAQVSVSCNPSFDNGCFNWYTRSVAIGNLNWTAGSDCSLSEISDTLISSPGATLNATVQSGNWCGIGLWIDFNRSGDYDTTENVFHQYGGSQVHTYQFSFSLPDSLSIGNYNMRLISGWGTDCYSDGDNGYGACGIYQYGNFQDIHLKLPAPTSIRRKEAGRVSMLPLRQDGNGRVFVPGSGALPSGGKTLLTIYFSDGRLLREMVLPADGLYVDLAPMPAGLYRFRSSNPHEIRTGNWLNP